MKIFAKRKKRSAPAPAEERTENKSDPLVEELLKKDPTEWNAKERRMVKRYQKRKEEEGKTLEVAASDSKASKAEDVVAESKKAEDASPEPVDSKNENDDDSSSGSGSSDGSFSEDSDGDDDEAAAMEEEPTEKPPSAVDEVVKENAPEPADKTEKQTDDKVDKDHEIWEMLNKLNSKQKRTLSRKLDRQGASVLEEVEKEAKEFLGESGDAAKESEAQALSTEQDPSRQPPSAKKRKKEADWSALTPEERLRREEQRRKQKEAAERRARGEDMIAPGHKRPLNSARRRANRRKPKWKKPSTEVKNEHNSSGYMHRKHAGQEFAEAQAC